VAEWRHRVGQVDGVVHVAALHHPTSASGATLTFGGPTSRRRHG
jgi:hypothetical protein